MFFEVVVVIVVGDLVAAAVAAIARDVYATVVVGSANPPWVALFGPPPKTQNGPFKVDPSAPH